MKKFLLGTLVIGLLLLDFAALDDITTGNEPNLYGEYLILTASALIFGFFLSRLIRKRVITKK
ncbi:MAG: hypothetical protein UX19_C0003G0027 [Candidatus Woesebacteria bacterium GW2011_GWA1_45_8]|uniref:Uncharacterized protein n=1 Tax=Candidatus Woesebacteria bacterium GW2011_GWA1_45_8 TaxID=1618559 RepID=A0A0G1MVS4_9BACT|nr:MAG: hypothetical protein UX19_C0003G0027 [Candidatus Woesebacteria bacterium GW2011_GWA1_45_8]